MNENEQDKDFNIEVTLNELEAVIGKTELYNVCLNRAMKIRSEVMPRFFYDASTEKAPQQAV